MNVVFSTYYRIAALLMGCFFVLTACENDQREVDQLFSQEIKYEEAFKMESYLSEGGIVKAKLTSPYMKRREFDSAYMEFPKTLHVDFYDSTSKVETVLDARYAKYFQYEQKILLRDSVVVISHKNGDTLRTNELWWDQNKQEFYTTARALILQRGQHMNAKAGLRAAQDLSWYDFYDANGVMLVPASGLPE
jgi:LPS export ABC transporter protein LptC